MNPPRQTYKAMLFDYDFLLSKSDAECSYCLSEREVQLILSQIDYIGWKTRYAPTDTEIDQDTILAWQGNLTRKLMSGCCGDDGTLHRYTSDGTYESSDDGGVTWYPDPESDPRNNVTYYPPMPGEDGDDKRCIAASSGQEYVKANFIDVLNDGMAYSEVYAIAVAIVAILGVTGIGILIAAAGAAIMLAGVLVVQAAFTSEVWADYKCILYCHTEDDGSITEDGWNGIKEDINSTFTGVVQAVLYNWANSVGYIGMTNANRSGFAAAGDCSSCDCPTPCIDPSWIISGTFNSESPTGIVIDSGPDAYGRPGDWISYGSPDPGGFCCTLTDFNITGGFVPVTSGWRDCDENFHSGLPLVGVPFRVWEAFSSGAGGAWQVTLGF